MKQIDSSSTIHYSGRYKSGSTAYTYNLNDAISVFIYDPIDANKPRFKKNYYNIQGEKRFRDYDFYEYDFEGNLMSWTDQRIRSENTKTNCVVNELRKSLNLNSKTDRFVPTKAMMILIDFRLFKHLKHCGYLATTSMVL